MGRHDARDPTDVANQVCIQLAEHWSSKPPGKPRLILTQGDPAAARGIAAITPRVAEQLNVPRGLICLDERIAEYHARDADRAGVIMELRYSQLAQRLDQLSPGAVSRLSAGIVEQIRHKNESRRALGQAPLKDYFHDFALLQEVTKAACSRLCDGITMIHTSNAIHPFSITSFYSVGLELGLVASEDIVPYALER